MKEKIIDLLISEGYKSYAIILSRLNIEVSDTILGCTNGKTITIKKGLTNDEISMIIRHEILHSLLSHFKYISDPQYNKQKLNISADLELSNFYSNRDKKITDVLGGVSVHQEEFKKYKEWNIIDIYNDLPDDDNDDKSSDHQNMLDLSDLSTKEQQELLEQIKEEINVIDEFEQIESVQVERGLSKDQVYVNKIKRYFIREEQVQKTRSYKRNNKKYNATDLIFKSNTNKNRPGRTLAVYCDLSGSMSEDKINKASEFVNSISKFKRVKLIRKYFSDNVTDNPVGGGSTNYGAVIDDIVKNDYTDICIVTDDDYYDGRKISGLKSSWIVRIDCNYTNIEKYIDAKDNFYMSY